MFWLNLDVSALGDLVDLQDVSKGVLETEAANLTKMTHDRIMMLAQERLHSTRNMFLSALSSFRLDDSTWVISLDQKMRWIDDGMSAHDMLMDLVGSKKAKRSKDGSTYLVVPFQLNKKKQDMTPAQQSLMATVKKELSKIGVSPTGIETDKSGQPKTGLVRSMDITKAPISTAGLKIGGGPTGKVAQGTTGGIPLLKGVRIYQKEIKDQETGENKIGRFIMTFRVASTKQKGGGKWQHPGTKKHDIFENALDWAQTQWDTKMVPGILAKIIAELS